MNAFLVDNSHPNVAGYSPVAMSASAIARLASSPRVLETVASISDGVADDAYTRFQASFYRAGVGLAGDAWRYADLPTCLWAAASLGKPKNYLEIGVRRGRSACIVASASPDTTIVGFDLWEEGYSGNDNSGPRWAEQELSRVGHRGRATFVSGDSKQSVPFYFEKNPDVSFDLITVDGDHSVAGARRDLENVVSRLSVGGVLLFDDICNPYCPGLREVWLRFLQQHPELNGYTYDELAPGIGIAVRLYPHQRSVPRKRLFGLLFGSGSQA